MKKNLIARTVIVAFTLLALATVAGIARTSATVAQDMGGGTADALAVLIAGEAVSSTTIPPR